MRPFHTVLGALGWVEINGRGPVSVLIVQPKGRKLVTRRCEFVEYMQGWVERWVK